MRRLIVSIAFVASISAAAESKPTLADFAWLEGCWTGESGTRQTEECWTAAGGGTMLGVFRIVSDGKTSMREAFVLEELPEGLVLTVRHFAAKMSDAGKPVSFPLKGIEKGVAVFENPEHDMPQRVLYSRAPDGSLAARIEGKSADGKVKSVDFPMRKRGK